MKTKGFSAVTAAMIAMDVICAVIGIWQTGYLMSVRDVLMAEHPDYLSHSWLLLALFVVLGALACGQVALARKEGMGQKRVWLCCAGSVLMIVLEVLTLGAAGEQHYHLGMLISDYGMRLSPFDGGWLMLLLMVALLATTFVHLMITFAFALSEQRELSNQRRQGGHSPFPQA